MKGEGEGGSEKSCEGHYSIKSDEWHTQMRTHMCKVRMDEFVRHTRGNGSRQCELDIR